MMGADEDRYDVARVHRRIGSVYAIRHGNEVPSCLSRIPRLYAERRHTAKR